MPARRLTADCIWNSFRSSGKRHLILTGSRGSGKTTLLAELFPEPQPGITTWAQPGKGVYLRENLTGRQAQVGKFDPTLPGPGNQMALLPEGFAALGVSAIAQCIRRESPWVTVDEIGYLEAQCAPYRKALSALMAHKQVAAVVRKQELPFLQELCLREDAFVVDLDDPFGNIGCVIMASGLGKRFGGNKLLADFHGRPMIHQILDATEDVFSQRIVVTRSDAVAALCRQRNIRTLLHHCPDRSDTVRLGLEAMPGIQRCMFATADQPLLRRDTVASLAMLSAGEADSIWRVAYQDTPGSPVVFPLWAFPELLTLPAGKGGGLVIRRHTECLRILSVENRYELMDVDTPEDLEKLQNPL